MRVRRLLGVLTVMLIAPSAFALPGPPALTQTERSTGRSADQATNPGYLTLSAAACAGMSPDPLACDSDPYRSIDRWASRGRVSLVTFTNRYGARLRGELYRPPANFRDPVTGVSSEGPFPLVVIIPAFTTPRQGYRWAAQGLAESGYIVLAFDVQGSGQSDAAPAAEHCESGGAWTQPQEMGFREHGSCAGQPPSDPVNLVVGQVTPFVNGDWSGASRIYEENAANYVFGALDAAKWLLESEEPIDATRIGVAGHSIGAYAAMMVGNGDPLSRFDAAIAWDGYQPMNHAVRPSVPTMFQQSQQQAVKGPTYLIPQDPEGFHPTRPTYAQFKSACVPTAFQVLDASAHGEWNYATGATGTALGERVAFHQSLAWFDRFLKGKTTAFTRGDESIQSANAITRLTAAVFDNSADRTAIGTGSFDPVSMTNNPRMIAGLSVAGQMSPFYRSEVNLTPCGS